MDTIIFGYINLVKAAPGDGEGQGNLTCCSPWRCKESDTTEELNNNKGRRVNGPESLSLKITCSNTVNKVANDTLFTTHLFYWGVIQSHENIISVGFQLLRTIFSIKKNERKKKGQEKYEGLYGYNS